MNFSLDILGSGSAIPSFGRFSSSQVLNTHGKSFMIDCADGTQFRMREMDIKTSRLGHLFISHLHGDHCFGIMAVISTMGMMHRTADFHIHAQPDLEGLLQPQLDYFCKDLPFKVIFDNFNPLKNEVIYEDRSLTIETIPLVHSQACAGFLFKEKDNEPHLIHKKLDFYGVSIKGRKRIKQGEDFVTEKGEVIPNKNFLSAPTPPNSYAYCSDTAYSERIIPIIKACRCLYHESTFGEEEAYRTKVTLHSTAKQAATIALKAEVEQLIIGHFSARYPKLDHLLEEAQTIFPNTRLGNDKLHLEW